MSTHRIAIVGRPNVGKSTLFNRLARRRHAITDATPGVTRDAVVADAVIAGVPVRIVDTGGIGEGEREFLRDVSARSRREIGRADVVLAVIDGTEFTGEDEEVLAFVRRSGRPAVLVINKIDNDRREDAAAEFLGLGFAHSVFVSAAHGLGIDDLEAVLAPILEQPPADHASKAIMPPAEGETHRIVRLAIVGQPNTGKSSLLNALTKRTRRWYRRLPEQRVTWWRSRSPSATPPSW